MSWTYIKKEHTDAYLCQHPQLAEHWYSLILLETQDAYFLPRYFYQNYPSEYIIRYNGKHQKQPVKISFSFNGELREKQQEAWNIINSIYNQNGNVNGILKLFPGAGKTVLSVWIAAKLGLKTCVVVDNDELMKQWVNAFNKFSNLQPDNIGIIKRKLWGVNKPIVVSMVQTLTSKMKNNFNDTFMKLDAANFGLIIVDEVHEGTNTENRAKSTLLFRTPNIIGLSATPFQYGAQDILMKNTVGNIIYETKDYDLQPIYYFVYYDSGLKKYSYVLANKITDYLSRKSFWNKISIKSQKYLSLIQNYCKNLLQNNYNTIIVCSTKAQVNMVSQTLDSAGLSHRRFYGDEREIDRINDKIIVATYKFIGKGFDMPSLSALILACPLAGRKSIIQVVGRILRSNQNKQQPLVIDLIDVCFPFMFFQDVKMKYKIIQNEFMDAKIVTHKEL